jgi:hypothetical protein
VSVVACTLVRVGKIVVGTDTGLTKYELKRYYERVFPDVYVPKPWEPSLRDRTVAAWLWSKQRGIVAGAAASALHGAQWVDPTTTIELNWNNGRPPPGLLVRNETLAPDEVTKVAGIPVTTLARTAFDLGRHLPRDQAVARLDALKYATPYTVTDVTRLARRYPGARGLKSLRKALPLVDGGAASPRETWLRLLLIDAGLPRPTTQIPVVEGRGRLVRMLDMGWEEFMVGAEYDGDQHRTDRPQYAKDVRVKRKLNNLGWNVTYVIKEDRPDEIVKSVWDALVSRGWRPR